MGHKTSKLFNEQQVMKDFMALTFRQIQYICQHTNLIDKEVSRRHTQFLNISKDGRMTKQQFRTILQDIWPTGNVQKFSNYLFNLWYDDEIYYKKKSSIELSLFLVIKIKKDLLISLNLLFLIVN